MVIDIYGFWVHKTSLTLPPVPSQKSKPSCIFVLVVSNLSLSSICLIGFLIMIQQCGNCSYSFCPCIYF